MLALLLALGCSSDSSPQGGFAPLKTAIISEGGLLRVPRNGGTPVLIRSDSLTPVDWRFRGTLPALASPLGVDRDDRIAWFISTRGGLVGIDLNNGSAQVSLTGGSQLTAASDGFVFGFDSTGRPVRMANRTVTRYQGKLSHNPKQLFRSPGGLVAVYTAADRTLQVLSDDGEVRRFEVPGGSATASWFGDLIAIANDSGVTFVRQTPSRNEVSFKRLKGQPRMARFSPSEHRLYVALSNGTIAVLDGLGDHSLLSQIPLGSPLAELRADRSGRWLMVGPEGGDSLWLIDLVNESIAGRWKTDWQPDLPQVVNGRTLLLRDGKDVAVLSLEGGTGVERTRLKGAAADFLIPVYWLPGHRLPVLASSGSSETTPQPVIAQDQAQPEVPDTAGNSWFIQVSSSQNPEYARTLADQLSEEGYPSRVIPPQHAEQGYRVLLGPYSSFERADTVGQKLGRAYFVLTLDDDKD